MPTRPIELPLVGGVREDIARELLPDGLLRSVHNYRVAKPGAIVRRRGYSNPSGTPIFYNAIGSNVVQMWTFKDQALAAAGYNQTGSDAAHNTFIYKRKDSVSWEEVLINAGLVGSSLASTAPLPSHRVRDTDDVSFTSAATVNGYKLVAWKDNGKYSFQVVDSAGAIIDFEEETATCNEVTTAACGAFLWLIFRDSGNLKYRGFDTTSDTVLGAVATYSSVLDTVDPAWDITTDNGDSTRLVFAFNHSSGVNVVIHTIDADQNTWVQDLGDSTTFGGAVADRGIAIAKNGSVATVLLAGSSAGAGELYAVMWDGELDAGNQQAAVTLDAAFDWTNGPFTCDCNTNGTWAAWSGSVRPTGYAPACDVPITHMCALVPSTPAKDTTYSFHRSCVGGKARDNYLWIHYGRASSLQRQYILVYVYGSYLLPVARVGYRVAGEQLVTASSHPLSQPCPDGNGNYIWAARELYDGELSRASNTKSKVGVVLYRYSLTSGARGSAAELGSLHLAGGVHQTMDGKSIVLPPYFSPDPMDGGSWVTVTGVGSLTGTYAWKVVYAAFDAAGNVWRSAPSRTLDYAGLSSDEITIRVEGLGLTGYWAEVYRQHTDNTWRYVGSTQITKSSATVDIVDTGASIATRELLYTTGGEPESYPTPASDIMVEWNRRLFVASGDQLYYSHSYDFADGRNLAPWMVETFYVQFQEVITGLAPLDSALLVFTASSIYLLTGDGPNRLGQGFYSNPQTISSDVGCVDWRSVAVFRDGVAFRSERGFELIPKGSYSVMPFGDPIEDTVASYTTTTSAVVQPELDQVRWTLRSATSGIVVAYDYIAKEWTTETAPAYDGALILDDEYTVWSGTAAVSNAAAGGGAYQQADQYVDDDGDGTTTAYTSYLETGDIRSSGKLGWQSVREVNLLGTLRANATIEIGVAIDGEDEFDDRESVAHYVSTDLTSGASLTGVTFVAATGVLTENSSLSVHQLYQSLAYQTTDLVYMRGVISGLGRGVAFGPLSQSRILLATDGTWSIAVTAGSVEGGEVQDLGGGRYLLEMLAYPTVSPRSWGIGGQSSGSLSYTGDGRDICTIESLEIGYASWTHGALRQSFSPMRGSCEALRVRVKDASTTQGAELAALRLEIKPKRGAGRLPKQIRS